MRAGYAAFAFATAVAGLGCGRGASSTTIGSKASAGPPTCVALDDASWWQRELIPSCPPAPLPPVATICEPGACARPCAAHGGSMGMHGGSWSARYTYDEAGHLLGSAGEEGPPTVCTWRDGLLEECTSGDWHTRAIRGAGGAITDLVIGDAHHAVVHDRGRVVSIGDAAVRYRDDGRIVAVGDRTIEYDAAGRIVAESDDRFEWAWAYDDRGRVRTIKSRLHPPAAPEDGVEHDLRERTQTFEYDDQGRLTATLNLGAHEDDSSGTYFDHDCP